MPDGELQRVLPSLKDWIDEFFTVNTQTIASYVGRNVLIEQVRSL